MFKLIIFSFVVFIFQLEFIANYNSNILQTITNNKIAFEETQRSVFYTINKINNAHKNRDDIFILGASSMREFIPLEEDINSKYPNNNILVCTTSGQPLIVSMLLLESIPSGSTVLLGMTPKKYWSEDKSFLKAFYEKNGFQIKYPLSSKRLDMLYHKYYKDTKLIPSSIYTLVELFKSYFLEQLQNIKKNGFYNVKILNDIKPNQHYSNYIQQLSHTELKNLEKKFFDQNIKSYDTLKQNSNLNLKILKEMKDIAKSNDLNLILFDIPLNNFVKENYTDYYKNYNEDLNKLGMKRVAFKGFLNDSSLFHDSSHLNKRGKEYFSEYFYKGFEHAISK